MIRETKKRVNFFLAYSFLAYSCIICTLLYSFYIATLESGSKSTFPDLILGN